MILPVLVVGFILFGNRISLVVLGMTLSGINFNTTVLVILSDVTIPISCCFLLG